MFFDELVWDIDTVGIVILAEPQASGCCEPGDELIALSTLDLVSSRHELRLFHIYYDLHFYCLIC